MQDWERLDRPGQARQLIGMLAELSRADGEVGPAERRFLEDVGRQHGLPAEEVARLSRDGSGDPAVLPTSEPERMTALYYLLFLSRVDHKVDTAEEAVLHRYGLRLGIRPALVDDFVGLARAYRGQAIPPAEMIGRIRAYLN